MHRKMLSADIICCIYLLTLLTNVSIEANRVDLDQTALGLHYLPEASYTIQQTTKQTTSDVIGILRVSCLNFIKGAPYWRVWIGTTDIFKLATDANQGKTYSYQSGLINLKL